MQQKRKKWIAVAAVAGAAWLLREVLAFAASILFSGILFAMLIDPVVRRFEKRMSHTAAVICAWAAAAAALIALIALMIRPAITLIQSLFRSWPQIKGYLPDNPGLLSGLLNRIPALFSGVGFGVGILADCCSRAAMAWIISVFLQMDKERYLLKAELMIPLKYRRRILRLGGRIYRELKLFVSGQTLVGLCVGALAGMGLLFVGIPNSLLLGVITGVCNLIPYFGPVLAAVPVLLVASPGGWLQVVLSAAVLVIVQQIDSLYLSPKIISGATGLRPLTVLLSLAIGGAAFGIAGLILAIPGALVLRIVFGEIVQKSLI